MQAASFNDIGSSNGQCNVLEFKLIRFQLYDKKLFFFLLTSKHCSYQQNKEDFAVCHHHIGIDFQQLRQLKNDR